MKPLQILLLAAILSFAACSRDDGGTRVLILAKSEFYFHESTPAAIEALKKLCEQNGWKADAIDDPWEHFLEEKLPRYSAVIFLNTAGDVLNPSQEALFERYIQAGGGFIGIHTAIDTEHNWDWYANLIGGRFDGMTPVQNAELRFTGADTVWKFQDEWFNLLGLAPDLNVLLSAEPGSFEGGIMGDFHPVSWTREYDGGRVFFTALGHLPTAYEDATFLQHLSEGLRYAVGDATPIVLKPRRSQSDAPTTTGFVKTSFVCNLYEPMEMDIFPDGKILIAERRGTLKLYDPENDALSIAGKLDVFIQNEEGLIGLAIDPNFAQNKWVFLYYAPKKGSALHLSRFEFSDGTLQKNTEKVLLEVPSDRKEHHYHAGGGLIFDEDGYLYLGVGDNTDHYDDGFAPIDSRPGKKRYDAQKSSANSMDLRGKILRIIPQPDGSYTCPDDNLYTGDLRVGPDQVKAQGLPEVFIMGVRNPFRMGFDSRRKLLMWGEPGPDAGAPDSTKGPEGYDEFNWTRTAGNFGWPYILGPNEPYREFDYGTNTPGAWFDPNNLVNNSPNNTGDKYLPPAIPSPIWYPFRSSAEFPVLKNGTRCAMGGPVYYCDQYPEATRFPDRFDGKFFIYEWMRHWMLTIELDSLDQLVRIEPFAPHIRLSRPMDMLIDKNGSVWVLEYGTEWYAQNPDACLTRIDYVRVEGEEELVAEPGVNRPPNVRFDFLGKNRSFYRVGDVLRYKVAVSDPEDGTLENGGVNPADVSAWIEYRDLASQPGNAANPFLSGAPFAKGRLLADASDCKSCHAIDRKISGPTYREIAGKYKDEVAYLGEKIVKGGSGVWGNALMSAHPDISQKDGEEIARWILSLKEPANIPPPIEGAYSLKPQGQPAHTPVFVFHAAYTDRGGNDGEPQQGTETLVLRPYLLQAEAADALSKDARKAQRNQNTFIDLKNGGFLAFKGIDLAGITALEISLEKAVPGASLELRLGTPDGQVLGKAAADKDLVAILADKASWPANGKLNDLYIVLVSGQAALDWVNFKT